MSSRLLYRTIVADPPWPYEVGAFKRMQATGRSANRKRDGERAVQGPAVARALPYEAMSLEDIADLPVYDLADLRGCRLFLWTTNRFLHDAFHIMDRWEFKHVQTCVWSKPNPVPFPIDVAPGSAEFLLTGTLGSPGRLTPWPGSVISQGVPKEHSRKPEVFLDLIEQSSPGPYVELFARRNRLGWDTWGNQALEHVEFAL